MKMEWKKLINYYKKKKMKTELKLEIMKQINLLFPLSKEPIAITSAIELAFQQAKQEFIEDEIKFLEKHKFPLNYNKEIIDRIKELKSQLQNQNGK